jgi:hypothetical protein
MVTDIIWGSDECWSRGKIRILRELGTVAHTCHPSYEGGGDQKD